MRAFVKRLLLGLGLVTSAGLSSSEGHFAVIYRSIVKPGYDDLYLKNWKIVANYFVQERGALGSTLHKSEDGMWVAYSRWPDRATRDASWPQTSEGVNQDLPVNIQQAIIALRDCFDAEQRLPEICMEVVEQVVPPS